MQKVATFTLYVFSIALAVGIGMTQAGKVVQGDGSDCPYAWKDTLDCMTLSSSQVSCSKTYDDAYGTLSSPKYRLKARNQCGFYTLTFNPQTGLYSEPEIFNYDPKCQVESHTPESCGE